MKIWREALVVFTVFFTTLALFPGVVPSLIPTNDHNLAEWFQIIMLAIFMVGDFIGRSAPRLFILFSPKTLWIPTVCRLVFFVLFVLCVKPRIFDSDIAAYLLMAVFAMTNGYCGTLAMMFGPVGASDHEKETAGIMMSFFLNFGIFVAIHFAFVLLYLLTGSIGITF